MMEIILFLPCNGAMSALKTISQPLSFWAPVFLSPGFSLIEPQGL